MLIIQKGEVMTQVVEYQLASNSGIEYLEKKGDGEVFVMLHGISSGAYSWIKQLQDSSIPHHLIAWNTPGYGNSKALANSAPVGKDYAERLLEFVDELGIEKFTLVGHSLGAMMVAPFAAKYPERVNRMVFVCPAQGYAGESVETKQEIFERRPKLLERLGNIGMANERGPFLLGNPNDENMEIVRTVSKGIELGGFTNASHLLAYDSIEKSLPNIECQIDLYYGEKDGITPPQGMFELKKKFNKIQLHEVPGAGHLAYIDAPVYFKETLFK